MGDYDCIPQIQDLCPPSSRPSRINSGRALFLEKLLFKILKSQGMRTSRSRIREFAIKISECESRSKRQKRLLQVAHRRPNSDILFWISEAYRGKGPDEALWRGFLAGHFGRGSADNSDTTQSAARFLCAFGAYPYWTWVRTSSATQDLRSWLIKNRYPIKSLSFGNHRKYESHKPLTLYKVISSFVDWVKENGGTLESAFQTNTHGTPEANFDVLYHSLKELFRFDRTGAFDLLCLLGNLGILPVRPGSCYLTGSTGPLRGARKLWGRRSPRELGHLADSTARALKVPFDIFEDALCMWQK